MPSEPPLGIHLSDILPENSAPFPVFRKWGAVRNGMEPLSVADPLRSGLLCRLKHARDSGVQVPGVPLVACQAMSVMRVGSGCVRGGVAWLSARLNYRAVSPWRVGDGSTMANQVGAAAPWRAGGVPGNNASTKPTPGASVRLGAPPPCPLPQPRQTGFAPLSPEQERRRVRAIRPFPPWPCGPFP